LSFYTFAVKVILISLLSRFCLLLLIGIPGILYAQAWEWANPFHAAGATTVSDMMVHHDSLIFASGTCFSAFNYNGTTFPVIPDDGPSKDSWLLRTDAGGNVVWHRTISSDNEVVIQQIAARNNRLYVAGKHKGTRVIFNNDTLFAPGNVQWIMFVAVYDLNGNYIAASQLAVGVVFTITDLLALNDLYIAGNFSQSIKVGTQVYNTAIDKLDIFVLKCDTSPGSRWFRHTPNGDMALIKANPAMDTLFVAAHYIDSLFMGPYTPHSSGSSVCLFATDTAFQLHWIRNIASDSVMLADAVFTNNRMYLTGWFNRTADFGNGMQPAPASAKTWLSSYSATNGTHASLLLAAGEHNYGKTVIADRAGNVYLAVRSTSGTTGMLNQTIDLSIFPGNEHHTVYKITGDSLLRYYRILSHTGLSDIRVSASDYFGNYYCGGTFAHEMQTDSIAISHDAGFVSKGFLAKISCVPAAPVITSPSLAFCPGDSAMLVVNTSAFYDCVWNTGDTATAIYTAIPGGYSVHLSDENQCISPASQVMTSEYTVLPVPVSRDCDTLSAVISPSSQGLWLYAGDTIASGISEVIAGPSGFYTLCVTDSNGCHTSDSIYQHQKVSLSIDRLCDTLTVMPPAGYPYFWTFGCDTIFNNLPSVVINGTGNFTVALTDSNGCYVADTVYQHAKPVIQVSRLCDTLGTIVPAGYDYFWIWQSDTLATGLAQIFSAGTGLYTVALTDSNGCIITAETEIYEKPLLSLTALCDTITAAGTNGYPYYWIFSGDTLSQNIPSYIISSPGSYVLVLTDSNGCVISDTLVRYPKPVISLQRDCDTLFANVSQPFGFVWLLGSDTLAVSAGQIYAATPGEYLLALTDSNSCYISQSITKFAKPIVSVSGVCDTLTATITAGYHFYWWYDNDTVASDLSQILSYGQGFHGIVLTDSNGCVIGDTLYQHQKVFASISRSCDTLFALVPAGYGYCWSAYGDTLANDTSAFYPDAGGWYSVNLTDSNGCMVTAAYEFFSGPKSFAIDKACDSLYVPGHPFPVGWYADDYFVSHAAYLDVSVVHRQGFYHAVMTDSVGCVLRSDTLYIGITAQNGTINIYPNPADDILIIEAEAVAGLNVMISKTGGEKVSVKTLSEETVAQVKDEPCKSDFVKRVTLDVSHLNPGAYILNLSNGDMNWNRVFIKVR
jgi:hypothetical protein